MRLLRALGWTMIVAGGLILAFLGYQLVGTNLITARAQQRAEIALEERFEEIRGTLEEPAELPAPSEDDPPPVTVVEEPVLYDEPAPEQGEPLGRIRIPDLGVEEVILQGVDRTTLKGGPGHMPWTPLPGQPGNAVVSGHRTTYGAPFGDLDELGAGDEIVVETALGSHAYRVREVLVVKPTDVWVTAERDGAWLTLTTCNPKFSARERLVVFAELVEGANFAYVRAVLDGSLAGLS